MRILFIVRSFFPDSSIASKRPSFLAKHLSQLGHEVYVIRSGCIFGKPDRRNLKGLEKIVVFSYEGKDSPADRFERGENLAEVGEPISNNGKKIGTSIIAQRTKNIVKLFIDPIRYYKNDGRQICKKIINLYNDNGVLREFDVIISSFGPLGCLQAGRYISKREKAKWVIDFRDLMDNEYFPSIIRIINAQKQKHMIKKADLCLCVSEGNTKRLKSIKDGQFSTKIYTIYNGYEEENDLEVAVSEKKDNALHICYTGTLHGGARDATPLFRTIKAINCEKDIRIDYAGRDSEILKTQASRFGLEEIIVDHGYLTSTEVAKLQEQSDLFLVLSWNTQKDQGILTGKFYEALQHRKPIVALVGGDLPNSELKWLIDHYHLGVCYESSTKNHSDKVLSDYIEQQVNRKKHDEPIAYTPDELVFDKFEYSKIAKQLECILSRFVNENGYEDN